MAKKIKGTQADSSRSIYLSQQRTQEIKKAESEIVKIINFLKNEKLRTYELCERLRVLITETPKNFEDFGFSWKELEDIETELLEKDLKELDQTGPNSERSNPFQSMLR